MAALDGFKTQPIAKEETLRELRQSTFDLFVAFISISTAAIIWIGNLRTRTSTSNIVLLWLGVEAICITGWLLRQKSLALGIRFSLIALWVVNAYAVQEFNLPFFLYLFTLLTMAASILASRIFAIMITILSTVYIALTQNTDPLNLALLPIMMGWFTLLTGFIAFHSFYEALDMAWSYQAYAVEQMFEAREHRGALMQTTKRLNELRQDLERANTQLLHAHRAAEEARRLKAQFAANVSHELRTPINLIVGFSETMVVSSDSYGVPLPPVYWSDMNTIYRSAKHLQSLINDVLDVSQIEAGKMAVVKEEIDSRQVIEEAANIARDLIESRGLQFKVNLPRPMPTMYLDRTRIRQVVLNLLGNAARFTDSGTITLSAQVEDAELRIMVQDTGIGIPAEDLDRVFEEFHQVESSLSRRKGGSGLGLTLSKQFVEQHGGRILAESEGVSGKGSTFVITLPLIDQSMSQKLGTGPLGVTSDGGRYFVVLDEDPAILQLFKRHSSKHHAIGVRTQEEALRLVDAIQPTALVLDVVIDHTAILNQLSASNNPIPVITCAMPSGRQYVQFPADSIYLEQPISGEALKEAIQRLAPDADNILVITDNRETNRMFARILQAISPRYHVWKAYSGEEGLALMVQQRPDLVLLDIAIADENGASLIESIQTDFRLNDIPLILTSASSDLDELRPADEGKIYIERTRGFEPMELIKCVEALVDVFTPIVKPEKPDSNPVIDNAATNSQSDPVDAQRLTATPATAPTRSETRSDSAAS